MNPMSCHVNMARHISPCSLRRSTPNTALTSRAGEEKHGYFGRKLIYVVGSGDYEAYSVNALFSRKADAEHYVSVCGGYIDEIPLDKHIGVQKIKEFQTNIYLNSGDMTPKTAYEQWELSTNIEGQEPPIFVDDDDYDPPRYPTIANVISYVSQDDANERAFQVREKWVQDKGLEGMVEKVHLVTYKPYRRELYKVS